MNEEVRREVGRRLRSARLAVGMTQEDVAAMLDPPAQRQTVSSWERGLYLPTTRQLYGVCQRFGASADYILFGIDSVPVSAMQLERALYSLRLAEVDQPSRY